jgi:hypothetical protein
MNIANTSLVTKVTNEEQEVSECLNKKKM